MTLGSFLIVGKFEDGKVFLFDEPVVAMRGNIENGDIARLEYGTVDHGTVEYVCFYNDGHTGNMRGCYITGQVMAAYDEVERDYDDTISSFLAGTGQR
jgi:hypothetical protein